MGKNKSFTLLYTFFAAVAIIVGITVFCSGGFVYAKQLKPGQVIGFGTDLPSEYIYRTDEIKVPFTGKIGSTMPEVFELALETEGMVFSEARIETVHVSGPPDADGLFALTGTVVFTLNRVTERHEQAVIRISVRDNKNPEAQVYTAASAEYRFKVVPKTVMIEDIVFEDKIYDGTDEIRLKTVVLNGIETSDEGSVWVDTEGVFNLTDSSASMEGWSLDFEKDSAEFLLKGDAAGNYILNTDGCEKFKARIRKRRIGLDPEVLQLVQKYDSDIYTCQNCGQNGIYNKALDEAVRNAGAMLYTNIVPADQDKMIELLSSSHPEFRADAEKQSLPGTYEIYAWPSSGMKIFENYYFDFSGGKIKAGKLTIENEDILSGDFKMSGVNLKQIDEASFYVRGGSEAEGHMIRQVQGKEKYNEIIYLDMYQGMTCFNPSKKAALWPEGDGRIAFKFVRKEADGKVSVETNPYCLSFASDSEAATKIRVTVREKEQIFDSERDFQNAEFFGNKHDTAVRITYEDEQSGVAQCSYGIEDYDVWRRKKDVVSALRSYSSWQNTEGAADITFEDGRYVVLSKVTDCVGNTAYAVSGKITVDSLAPQVDIVMPQAVNGLYNSDVTVKFKADDAGDADSRDYSGLKSADYKIKNHGKITQSGTIKLSDGNLKRRTEAMIKVGAVKNNSNDVELYLKIQDRAGNITERREYLKIDTTKPEISVVFDRQSPRKKKYYKTARTASIIVRERNFDPGKIRVNVLNTKGKEVELSDWFSDHSEEEADRSEHRATIVFDKDGTYQLTVDCRDQASNTAKNPYVSEVFVIDRTQPVINVSYDRDQGINGQFYRCSRTALITVHERNFMADDINIYIRSAENSEKNLLQEKLQWTKDGDIYQTSVHFNSDGTYTLGITCVDAAGNDTRDYTGEKFTIDMTKPEIEIIGIKDESANNGSVAPEIKVTDTNFNPLAVTFSVTGVKRGKISADTMTTKKWTDDGMIISMDNFPRHMDDIYTLTAESSDKAGNTEKRSITFSVNRNGSDYILSNNLNTMLKMGVTNCPKDVVIEEINTDTLIFKRLAYSKDGKIVTLKEGVDYTVRCEGGRRQWKRYIYTVKADCFNGEGVYNVTLYSKDSAGNQSTNRTKGKDIEFVVDKTPPVMSIANIEDGGRYKEERHTFTVSLRDNTGISSAELYLNDRLWRTYDKEMMAACDGTLIIDIDSREDDQTVRVMAYDHAGNAAESETYHILVTSDRWIQLYRNKPMLIAAFVLIAVLVLAAGLCTLLVVKKRMCH